jgi:hypothetical protein
MPSALAVFRLMPVRSGLMSQLGQSRRFDRGSATSGLPPINGHPQTAPACRKSATGLNRSRGRALRRAAWPWMDERVA